MKNALKYSILFSSVFAITGGASFVLQYKPTKPRTSDPIQEMPLTPGEKLINSVLGYEAMGLKANISMLTDNSTKIEMNFDGQGSIRDLENIKVGGSLDLNIGGNELTANLSYFGKDLAFNFEDNYFRLNTDDLLAFIDMVPTYGANIELPSDLNDISLDTIEDIIIGIEEKDKVKDPTGGYYYVIPFGELDIHVKTDSADNLLGLRTDTIFYKGMKFKLDVDITSILANQMSIINPLETNEASKYQNFQPAFKLIDSIINFTNQDQMNVNIALDLDKRTIDDEENETIKDIINTSIDLNIDKPNKFFSLSGDVYENSRTHSFLAAFDEDTIYASFHKVNVSIKATTISSLINYVFDKVGDDLINDLLNGSSEAMASVDLNEIISKAKSTLGNIYIEENKFTVNLNLASFNLTDKDIPVSISWEEGMLKELRIEGLDIKGILADLVVTFSSFNKPVFDKEIFVELEPAAGLISAALDLIKQKQFRVEFDALVDKADPAETDITINGGVQFDIEDMFGYGDITIVDSNSYQHKIKGDMFNKDAFFFSYNDKLKGKFTSQTLKDMIDLVTTVVADPDEHFMELFGGLLDNLEGSPINKVMEGEYGALLEHDIISNLVITDSNLSLDISLELLDIDMKPHINIDYVGDIETLTASITKLSVSGIEMDGASISLNAYLKEFNNSLESTRLSPYDEYFNFSDIKVLLELGINTSKFNYYHFKAKADIKLLGGLLNTKWINETIDIDVKIRNEKGNVKVAAELKNLPIISIATPNPDYTSEKNRQASLYYYEDTFYIRRTEEVKKKSFLGLPTGSFMTYELTRVCDTDFFLENILEIFLSDILSCSDTIMNLIDTSDSTKTESEVIHYEEILNDFTCNLEQSYFLFDINLGEIAHDKMFSLLMAKIYYNPTTQLLKKVEANLEINLTLLKLRVDLNLEMQNDYTSEIFTYDGDGNITGEASGTSLTEFETFYNAHKNDTKNTRFVTVH